MKIENFPIQYAKYFSRRSEVILSIVWYFEILRIKSASVRRLCSMRTSSKMLKNLSEPRNWEKIAFFKAQLHTYLRIWLNARGLSCLKAINILHSHFPKYFFYVKLIVELILYMQCTIFLDCKNVKKIFSLLKLWRRRWKLIYGLF